jgi:hypothetical protein
MGKTAFTRADKDLSKGRIKLLFRTLRVATPQFTRVMKEYAQKILLVALGIVFALLTAELTVRFLPERFLPPPLRDLVQAMNFRAPSLYIQDPELGYLIRPGIDFVSTSNEYSFRIKTNLNYDRAGFRGGTLGGPVWGVALGDSFTFGFGVDQESTWVAQLANLSRREIVNLGVQGYGPQQYTRTLEKYGTSLHPKIVFYCLFTNDLKDSDQFDNWMRHPSPRFSLETFLRNHSVLVNLYHRWRRSRTEGSRYVNLDEVGQSLSLRKLKEEIISDNRRVPTAWPLIAREIDKASVASRQAHATFMLLYFPSKEEVYWDAIKQKMKSLEALDDRVGQLKKITLQFCRSRQLICLDLTPALKKRANLKEKLYFSIDTHWNELGHKVVATEIHRFLVSEKLL